MKIIFKRSHSAILVVALLLAAACSSQRQATSLAPPTLAPPTLVPPLQTDLRETPDPDNVIHTLRIEDGKLVASSSAEIPKDAFSFEPFDEKDERSPEVSPPQKIHPLLEKWIASRDPDAVEAVIINFRDTVQVPRFPEPAVNEPRDSPTNKRVLARNAEIIAGLRAKRADDDSAMEEKLRAAGGRVTEHFWLVRGVEAKLPLSAVRKIAEQDDVLYVEPVQTEDRPPQNANPKDDVDDGRARINSEPFFSLGQTAGFIGLLDTGIRHTHVQFNAPSHIDFRRDCVNGGEDCNTGALNTADDCWNHGTQSAAIITGNSRQGAAFRGVTAMTLDSFKVYPSTFGGLTCTGSLNTTAVVRGFQNAVASFDRVIVAEMQGGGDHKSAISVAANSAFDAGAVIIAANGNSGPTSSTVAAPANAHRVLGVGNFDVQTQAAIPSQSRGPTSDSRIKPDIQAPTNTETAGTGCLFGVRCAQSDTALQTFIGTSGATPYAAGAAALVRNFLRSGTGVIDPGQVYAFLIMAGQLPYPLFDNARGVGPVRIPNNATIYVGRITISNGGEFHLPLWVSGSLNRFDVALWWPETTTQRHSNIDLFLTNPSGVTAASSTSVPSVFERLSVPGPFATGVWTVRVRGRSVASPQVVYYAFATQ